MSRFGLCIDFLSIILHTNKCHSETVKRVLNLPGDTNLSWKSHDDSISQRSAIDQARQDKSHHGPQEKRRMTVSSDDGTPLKDRANAL